MLLRSLHNGGISHCGTAQRRLLLLDVLTDEWETADTLAKRAGVTCMATRLFYVALADVGDVQQKIARTRGWRRIYQYRRNGATT